MEKKLKQEIRMVIDTDQARQGLKHAGLEELYMDSDERIVERALNYVERFGFNKAHKNPTLNTNVEKSVTIKIDTKVARIMLGIAGFNDLGEKSDDEIFEMAMDMITCYGVTWNHIPDSA